MTITRKVLKGDWMDNGYHTDFTPRRQAIILDDGKAYYADEYDMGVREPLFVNVDREVGPKDATVRFLPDDGELDRVAFPAAYREDGGR